MNVMTCAIGNAGADRIIELLSQNGFGAYYVGGCVRDSIMGRTPHDFDIATDAEPDECMAALRGAGLAVIETGIKHGTVTAIADGRPYEITTFRQEGKYEDNRRPSSVFYVKDIKSDMARRDFTINAMAIDKNGRIIDYFGGADDIKNKIIRCVGDPEQRFKEDALRIMRTLRFSAVLGFNIDKNTSEAVYLCREMLKNISAERICAEFSLIMTSDRPSYCIREYIDVFGVFIPELLEAVGFRQNNPWHIYDVFEHTMTALDNTPADIITRLAVLFHDIGKPRSYTEDENGVGHFKGHAALGAGMACEILSRLRFPGRIRRSVCMLIKHHDDRINPDKASVKRLIKRLGYENAMRMADVELADSMAHNPVMIEARIKDIMIIKDHILEIERESSCLEISDLAVNGYDIMLLGVPRGKRVGEILSLLLEAVIDEKTVNSREALIKLAREMI